LQLLFTVVNWQPVAGTQLSEVQLMPSSHVKAVPATHWPLDVLHVSAPLHMLLSLHCALVVHSTSQVPAWHNPLLPEPFWHGVLFTTLVDAHPVPVHTSAVQGLLSLHDAFTVVLVQPVSVHTSVVQATLSSQAELTVVFWH
jgi:hypothetical protein